jgi:tRNA (guanine37-N1)-methyltransferase
MRFDIVTIFPEFFASPLKTSLLGKAISSGVLKVDLHDLRNWAEGPHRKVDDEPYGGGAGMVMAPAPIVGAVESLWRRGARVVVLSASGRPLRQSLVSELAETEQVVLVCGRYEGIDARVVEILGAEEVSVGEFVLAGGETAALAVIEAVARLVEGVIGNVSSLSEESFSGGLLEYPQYTRPAEFRGLKVPEILLSGDHAAIARWRREQAMRRTMRLRPELLETADLTSEEEVLKGRLKSEDP